MGRWSQARRVGAPNNGPLRVAHLASPTGVTLVLTEGIWTLSWTYGTDPDTFDVHVVSPTATEDQGSDNGFSGTTPDIDIVGNTGDTRFVTWEDSALSFGGICNASLIARTGGLASLWVYGHGGF